MALFGSSRKRGKPARRQRLTREDRKGVALFSLGVLVLGALGVFAVQVVRAPERDYDRVTLCNPNLPRFSQHIVVIDASDTLSPHQTHFLDTHLAGLLESAAVNDRFSIFVLDDHYNGLSKPVVDLCKPHSGEDVSALTANQQFVQALYRERFEQPLDEAINRAVSAGEQPVSPIYEALSDVAALNHFDPAAKNVHLTIVSDMIQNSRAGSVFKRGSAAIDQLPLIDLRRAKTRVFWLDREKYQRYQTAELEASWQDYLGSVSRLEQIQRVRD
ncbi:hypothetical protein [Microbulbifer hydrolyticus]|uniref:VWA domain-containing protein n=1 Tax=Microbulbifer hydrolyticus TaxID=48074 RepID=A0A6P1TER9_9GAMM|nr:hypothetical protein [Microbulbifer hydrolyticus]MBB5212072.1 hypothetical protein [Microbulbifer hydrolyticus]QHQ39749.1 hypothetical protein GTQ55_12655 [Microbulbifer hydrolyticus]